MAEVEGISGSPESLLWEVGGRRVVVGPLGAAGCCWKPAQAGARFQSGRQWHEISIQYGPTFLSTAVEKIGLLKCLLSCPQCMGQVTVRMQLCMFSFYNYGPTGAHSSSYVKQKCLSYLGWFLGPQSTCCKMSGSPRFLVLDGSLFGCLKNAQGVPEAVSLALASGENSVVWDREHDCFSYDCLIDGRHVHMLESALGPEPQVSAMVDKLRDPQCPAKLQLARASLVHIPRGNAPPLRELPSPGGLPSDRAPMAAGGEPRGQTSADAELFGTQVCRYMCVN